MGGANGALGDGVGTAEPGTWGCPTGAGPVSKPGVKAFCKSGGVMVPAGPALPIMPGCTKPVGCPPEIVRIGAGKTGPISPLPDCDAPTDALPWDAGVPAPVVVAEPVGGVVCPELNVVLLADAPDVPRPLDVPCEVNRLPPRGRMISVFREERSAASTAMAVKMAQKAK